MNKESKKCDMKKLVEDLNMLTGILSNVKEARSQMNSALNYRSGNSNFPSVHHGRPPLSHSTFGVSRNPSVPYKKPFPFHKNPVIGPNISQKFVIAQSGQNHFEKTRHLAHPHKLYNSNINTKYTKTNVKPAIPTSGKTESVLSSANPSSVMKIDNALSGKYEQPCDGKNTGTKDAKESKVVKCNEDVSSQSRDHYGSPLKTAPSYDEEPSDIFCEIFPKTDDSNRDTCPTNSSDEMVEEIEVVYDSKVQDFHQDCKPEKSSVTVSASSLKDSTNEKINKISKALAEMSRRKSLKGGLSVDKLHRRSLSKTSQNSRQIWKSKYKVINRHIKSNLEKTKVTRCVQSSVLLENTDPNQIASNSHSLNNQYKLVKNSNENKSSVEHGSSNTKMLLNSNKLLSAAANKNITTENGTNNSNSVKYSFFKSPSKKLSSLIAPSSSFAAQISSSKADSTVKLNMKLKELERQTRSHYQGYDLSKITPMELVSLDHKSLLKIVANEKKPESFVKKSKYKLESKSTNEKQWNKSKPTPATRLGIKLATVHKPINQTDSHKTRVVMIRGMKYQVGSSGKCMKAVLKRNIDKNTLKTPLKRPNGITSFLTNTPQQARNVASRVLNRSIRSVRKASRRTSPKSDAYCIFFNRFGRCNTGDSCPYIHDPKKIAVCTRFLKGSCKRKGCPFSHEINPGKMAICSFYLRGACKKDNLCPYRHELLKPGTELCKAFVRGYCPNGSECEKAHILSCPDYMRGCCKKEDCQYPHPPRKVKRKIEDSFVSLKKSQSNSLKEEAEVKQVEDDFQESDFRYFSHDPNTGEIKIFTDDNNDGTILPKRLSDITGLADFIPLKSKTQYKPEEFSDAECLE